MSKDRTSKFIALILRHKPEVIGITLDEHGWADVDALIAGIAKTHVRRSADGGEGRKQTRLPGGISDRHRPDGG